MSFCKSRLDVRFNIILSEETIKEKLIKLFKQRKSYAPPSVGEYLQGWDRAWDVAVEIIEGLEYEFQDKNTPQ